MKKLLKTLIIGFVLVAQPAHTLSPFGPTVPELFRDRGAGDLADVMPRISRPKWVSALGRKVRAHKEFAAKAVGSAAGVVILAGSLYHYRGSPLVRHAFGLVQPSKTAMVTEVAGLGRDMLALVVPRPAADASVPRALGVGALRVGQRLCMQTLASGSGACVGALRTGPGMLMEALRRGSGLMPRMSSVGWLALRRTVPTGGASVASAAAGVACAATGSSASIAAEAGLLGGGLVSSWILNVAFDLVRDVMRTVPAAALSEAMRTVPAAALSAASDAVVTGAVSSAPAVASQMADLVLTVPQFV